MTLPKLSLLCAAAILLSAPITAEAQIAAAAPVAKVDNDARCLAASIVVGQQPDERAKVIGAQGQIYFLGRIDGHGGSAKLQQRLNAQFAAFNAAPQSVRGIAQNCVKLLGERINAYHPIADHYTPRSAAPASAPPSVPPVPFAH